MTGACGWFVICSPHRMRVLCAAFIFATGCFGGGERALTVGGTSLDPVITTKACEGLPMDPYQLGESMSVEATTLRVSVSYGGGCEDHTFAACWDGSIAQSDPESLLLTLAHDDHGDLCDAFVTRDLFIDISDLPAGFKSPVRADADTIRLVQLLRD